MVENLLSNAVSEKIFPGASYAYGDVYEITVGSVGQFGYAADDAPVTLETTYDLASLTKVLCTTPLVLESIRAGKLRLTERVCDILPQFKLPDVTVQNLLLHDSGLSAYYAPRHGQAPGEIWHAILQLDAEFAPGTKTTYSCLGFIVLQKILESRWEEGLDALFERLIAKPLGMDDVRFRPTGHTPPTGSSKNDLVHDPLARAFGGVSGNAGLFGSIQGVSRFAQAVLKPEGDFGTQAWAGWTTRCGALKERGLGWDIKSDSVSSAGTQFSARSFGHTGFTGTMIWIDPESCRFAVLLSNAVVCDPDRTTLMNVRAKFCDLAWLDLDNEKIQR